MVQGLAWEHFTKGPCFPNSDPWKHDVLWIQTPKQRSCQKDVKYGNMHRKGPGKPPSTDSYNVESVPERLEQNQVHVWSWASMVGESYSFELVHRRVPQTQGSHSWVSGIPFNPRAACCSLPLTDGRNSERNSMTEHFPNSEVCTSCWGQWFPGDSGRVWSPSASGFPTCLAVTAERNALCCPALSSQIWLCEIK